MMPAYSLVESCRMSSGMGNAGIPSCNKSLASSDIAQ